MEMGNWVRMAQKGPLSRRRRKKKKKMMMMVVGVVVVVVLTMRREPKGKKEEMKGKMSPCYIYWLASPAVRVEGKWRYRYCLLS